MNILIERLPKFYNEEVEAFVLIYIIHIEFMR